MRLQEVCQNTGLTRKAIEWYQKQGFIQVRQDANGYRNFTAGDVARLREIAVLRQLGLSTADMRQVLDAADKGAALQKMADKQQAQLAQGQAKLQNLRQLAQDYNESTIWALAAQEQALPLLERLKNAFPGFFGQMLAGHFAPFLADPIETLDQATAYRELLSFLDGMHFTPPVLYRFLFWYTHKKGLSLPATPADALLDGLLSGDENTRATWKERLVRHARQRQKWWVKYSPLVQTNRTARQRLEAARYYQVVLPLMRRVSPSYNAYAQKLEAVNEWMMRETGIRYDEKGYVVFAHTPMVQ